MNQIFEVKVCPADFQKITKKAYDPKKAWYAYVEYIHPVTGKLKQRRLKKDINRIHNLEDRKTAMIDLRRATEQRLKEGWNPIPEKLRAHVKPKAEIKSETFFETLRKIIEKKYSKKKTRKAFEKCVDGLHAAAKRLCMDQLTLKEVTRGQLYDMFDEWQENDVDEKGKKATVTNKTYNKHLGFMSALYTAMVDRRLVDSNIAWKMHHKDTPGKVPRKQLQQHEKPIVRDFIEKRNPNFWTFCLAIYHTGARIEELLSLQVKHVNMISRMIVFNPDITKPEWMKRIPIHRELMARLQAYKIEKCDPEHYLFGSPYLAGIGSRGQDHTLPTFCPFPTRTSDDTANRLWRVMVKESLKIDADLYGLKGLSGNDKRMAGVPPETVQHFYGHQDQKTTDIYIFESNREKFMEIAEQSPDFIAA